MPPSSADPTPLLSNITATSASVSSPTTSSATTDPPDRPPPFNPSNRPAAAAGRGMSAAPPSASVSSANPPTFPSLSSVPYPPYSEGFFSILFFNWVDPILTRGRKGPITPSDLFASPHHMLAATYTTELQTAYTHYASMPSPPSNILLRAVIRAFRRRYFVKLWIMRCVLLTLTMLRPFVLRELLVFVSAAFVAQQTNYDDDDQYTILSFKFASYSQISDGIYWSVTLSLLTLVMAFLNHHFWWYGVQLALSVRGGCIGMLYAKSLSMHTSHRHEYSSGRISNLASVDGDNMMNFMWGSVHELIAAPLLIVLCVAALIYVLGVSALIGVATLIASLAFTSYLARRQSFLQDKIMHVSDKRVSAISELLTSIKLIKLYSWQLPFSNSISKIRAEQEGYLYRSTAIGAITRCLGLSSPLFVSFTSFVTYSALGHTIDATTAFTALLLFNQLKEPMGKLPECVTSLVKMWISQRRIQAFLAIRDKEEYITQPTDALKAGDVLIDDGWFSWGVVAENELHAERDSSDKPHTRSPLSHAHASPRINSPPLSLAGGANSTSTTALSGPLLPGIMHRLHSDDDSEDADYHSMDDGRGLGLGLSIDETEMAGVPSPLGSLTLSRSTSALSRNSSAASTAPPSPTAAPTLRGVTCRIPAGSRVMIVGSVGAGKSSLLQCLLGEMHRQSGTVQLSRRVAYTSQVAFLQSASIRNNILLGLPMDEPYYRRVLHACALLDDLTRLPSGDGTLVGENGLTLSGGQKMRVILARAVYSRADVYLCDEPLGAVDAHVGLHLFDNVFGPQGMLAGKTVLLVTHQLQFAPRCDLVMMMEEGKIVQMGSYDELQSKGIDFRAIVSDAHTGDAQSTDEEAGEERKEAPALPSPKHKQEERKEAEEDTSSDQAKEDMSASTAAQPFQPQSHIVNIPINHSSPNPSAVSSTSTSPATSIIVTHTSTTASEDITSESLNVGTMRWTVYKQYFLSGASMFGWVVVVALVLTSQAAVVGSDYVVAWLTTAGVEREKNPDSSLPSQNTYLLYYLYFVLASTVLLAARCLYLAYVCTTAGRVLHRRLFFGLLRSPQWWMEMTPSGRVLNRVGKDQDMADSQLPGVIQDIFACAVAVAGTIVLTIAVTPLSLPFLALIFALYLLIQRSYRPSSVALKRLESVSRSPIYQHMGETAAGLITLRAYSHTGSLQRALLECYHRLDLNTRVYFYSFAVHRWMGLRLETLGAATVFLSAIVALFLLPSLSPGLIGLVITTSLGLSGQLHWLVRQRTEMEVQLNAVERIIEYANLQPEESNARWNKGVEVQIKEQKQRSSVQSVPIPPRSPRALSSPAATTPPIDLSPHSSSMLIPPASWPEHGRIEFHSLTAAYRPPPNDIAVLHNLSAVIQAGEKVGIVGRTGAGKSTVSLCLFRLMEAKSGYVTIDGYPIHRIPLHLLRSKLMIIPQDPVLFAHSLRYNLDPFHHHTDTELWHVLDTIGLKELVSGLPGKLSYQVADGGENLSMGQRQLICLGRALLRPSQILVMDEASASLDLQCDQTMKHVIRSSFQHCTILTIAHRLNTVLQSDRIMVFEAGKLKEFNAPARLLQQKGGLLAQLMEDAQTMTSDMRGEKRGEELGKADSDETEEQRAERESRSKALHDEQRVKRVN